ncbi:MAG: hypothetical protein EOO38_02950 [Cytophagaceae bacterium]|nr:MAG: hypothetical protein EOO38_02950 [Cytophagaceae bacterium]
MAESTVHNTDITMISSRLHWGCGGVIWPSWLNIDLEAPLADLKLDLRNPLPFPSQSVELFFAEPVIEHLLLPDAYSLLKECRRVLALESTSRISTSNLEYLEYAYLTGKIGIWRDLWGPEAACRMVNEGMRSWGHEFLYDYAELHSMLLKAGFNDVQLRPPGKSANPLRRAMESRPFYHDLISKRGMRWKLPMILRSNVVSTRLQRKTIFFQTEEKPVSDRPQKFEASQAQLRNAKEQMSLLNQTAVVRTAKKFSIIPK